MIVKPEQWVNRPDESLNGLLSVWLESGDISVPLLMETHNVEEKDVRLGENQEFEIIIEAAENLSLYIDEEAFYSAGSFLASESIIPSGMFSPDIEDESFVRTARAIINGRITKTYASAKDYGFDEDDAIFTMECQGYKFDAVWHEAADRDIELGNIVSGTYWITGWPKES